jgi:S1-C subfamily serine protease
LRERVAGRISRAHAAPSGAGGSIRISGPDDFRRENEAYIPPAAGAVSLGFAIPAATAVDIADQLLADGNATHPYLGVSLGRLTPQIRQTLGVGVATA